MAELARVLLELAYAERDRINDRYAAFRGGTYELGPGEAEQVAFRVVTGTTATYGSTRTSSG